MDAYEAGGYTAVTRTAQNNDSQTWIVTPADGGTYTIVQKNTKLFLDAFEDSGHDYKAVTRKAQHDGSQQWIFTPLDDETYKIQQKKTERFLDAYETEDKDFMAVTRTAQQDTSQHWILTKQVPVGKKKALLVGINYIGTSSQLGGCINDVKNQKRLLIDHFGFSEDDILMLTEDQGDDSKLPTSQHMREGFKWLLRGASKGDFLFFAYSGHGSQIPNKDGTESDGRTEILCPLDIQANWYKNAITDDYLNDVFFKQLPPGVRCVITYDCCHSGTMTDLPVSREIKPDDLDIKYRFLEPPEDIKAALQATTSRGIGPPLSLDGKLLWTISGCQDAQLSADATIGGQRQGAMTWALMESLAKGGPRGAWTYRYDDLIETMRAKLKAKGFSQDPALCTTDEKLLDRFYLDHFEKL